MTGCVVFLSVLILCGIIAAKVNYAPHEVMFTLKEEDEKVVIYSSGEKMPWDTDIRVNDLRKADRAKLSCGIEAETRAELIKLIEDLNS